MSSKVPVGSPDAVVGFGTALALGVEMLPLADVVAAPLAKRSVVAFETASVDVVKDV